MAVRIGNIDNLLSEIGDVFCIICNTIMTCQTVVEMSRRRHPVIWILHEWWDDDMIIESFKLRNIENLTLDTVKTALKEATMVVFVCDSQRQLYKPSANSDVIFVGVPDPFGSKQLSGDDTPSTRRSRSNTLNSSAGILYTVYCILYIVYYILYIVYYIHYTLYAHTLIHYIHNTHYIHYILHSLHTLHAL